MKEVLVLFAVVVLAGCAHMQGYESVQTGPRAKINFISPHLRGGFIVEKLELEVFEPDDNCVFTSKGRISLSTDTKSVATYVPANQRAHFRIRQYQVNNYATKELRMTFSLVPQDGAEYTIEHIDNPSRLRVNFYKHDRGSKKIQIEVQGFDACEKNSGARAP
jgi:hypothetical protein